jgi:hypothetical protein
MVKVDIGPWRSSGNRIFSASLIGVPDLCFHDSSDCGLDRGGRWFLCQPLQSPDIVETHFAADTAEEQRATLVWEVDASRAVAADGCVACGDRLLLCASGEIEEPGVAGFETARAAAEDKKR